MIQDLESDEELPYIVIPNDALNPTTVAVLIQDPSDGSDDEESDNDETDEESEPELNSSKKKGKGKKKSKSKKSKKRKFPVSSLPTFYRRG